MTELFEAHLLSSAELLLDKCREHKLKIATAESCTGGLVAGVLTAIAGSSDVFDRGFVTYSNEAKSDMLDVPQELIRQHGAVSSEVARSMAIGALNKSRAHLSVSITGIAGPGGATSSKPVGLVYISITTRAMEPRVEQFLFDPRMNRSSIRERSVEESLRLLHSAVDNRQTFRR
jgi:nicotinamide-nucleotide amidase